MGSQEASLDPIYLADTTFMEVTQDAAASPRERREDSAIHATRYTVGEEVGRGGMGQVLEARDNDLLRPVAMKVLSEDGPAQLRRFVQEAQLTSQLDHPAVLPVYELGQDERGVPFFTMKLIPAHETLKDVIERLQAGDPEAHAHYTFQRRVQIVQKVCQALHYAHERGVVHRDVKPANIIVGRFGEVYLLDWGIARLRDPGSTGSAPAEVRLPDEVAGLATQEGALVGTPAYMSPEQIMDPDAVDAVSDVYSLAVVLYELLTLRHYLAGVAKISELIAAIITEVPKPAETWRSKPNGRVPRVLSRLLERALLKDRARRYQSALEFEEALQQWFEGNAPIVCAGTAMQRLLARWINAVDAHPFVIPTLCFLIFALFLRWVIVVTGEMWVVLQTL